MEKNEIVITESKEDKAIESKVICENSIIEKIAITLLCFAGILLSVCFTCGLLTFNGKSVSVLTAIEMIVQILEVSDFNYDFLANFLIGILYFVFLIKNFIDSFNCSKRINLVISNSTPKRKFKEIANYIMNKYYSILNRQFLFIMIGGMVKRIELTKNVIIYFAICLFAFAFSYVVRLLWSDIEKKACIFNFAQVTLFLIAGVSSCLITCKPVIQNIYDCIRQFKDVKIQDFKSGIILIYDSFVDNLLFVALMICLISALKKMFDETTTGDLFFFEAKADSKSVLVCCGITFLCRIIVDVYLKEIGAVDIENIMSVLNYIFTYNRHDIIPLAILGTTMLLNSVEINENKKQNKKNNY